MRMARNRTPHAPFGPPDVRETPARACAIRRINHAVAPHHDDDLTLAADMLDLHFERAVTNPPAAEQLEKTRLLEYLLQRRVDHIAVGQELLQCGDVRSEERNSELLFPGSNFLFPRGTLGMGQVGSHRCSSLMDQQIAGHPCVTSYDP